MIRILTILFLCTGVAHAEFKDAYSATCRIVMSEEIINNKFYKGGCGTGVVFRETADSYLVLTAGHVAEVKEAKCYIQFFHSGDISHQMWGKCIHIEYKEADLNKDLAIIELSKSELKDYPKPKVMSLGQSSYEFKEKEIVTSIGGPGCKWISGWIGHFRGHRGERILFLPTPFKGRSGSAIFDSNYRTILGIITRVDGQAIGIKKINEFIESIEQPMAEVKPVIDLPYEPSWGVYKPGWEERGPEFRRWLAPSVRVTRPGGGGGSGTICHWDGEYAYVISCGHLYPSGRGTVEDLKQNPIKKVIRMYYRNNEILDPPKDYDAQTIAYVWNGVYDVSVLKFKPDWEPWVCKIAPKNFKYKKGELYHSCGCDGLRPVAHYLVKFVEELERKGVTEVLTQENGPRKGRSGGGVFTDDHQLLFICSRGGGGYGYWSSLFQIHSFLEEEKLTFILIEPVRTIPIVDHGPSESPYPRDYIPIPRRRAG